MAREFSHAASAARKPKQYTKQSPLLESSAALRLNFSPPQTCRILILVSPFRMQSLALATGLMFSVLCIPASSGRVSRRRRFLLSFACSSAGTPKQCLALETRETCQRGGSCWAARGPALALQGSLPLRESTCIFACPRSGCSGPRLPEGRPRSVSPCSPVLCRNDWLVQRWMPAAPSSFPHFQPCQARPHQSQLLSPPLAAQCPGIVAVPPFATVLAWA